MDCFRKSSPKQDFAKNAWGRGHPDRSDSGNLGYLGRSFLAVRRRVERPKSKRIPVFCIYGKLKQELGRTKEIQPDPV